MNTDLYVVNIDTRFKPAAITNSADYTYIFSTMLKNVSSIKLSSIEFPNLYYTFSAKKNNNFFTINFNNTNYVVSIKDGVYSSTNLLTAIQAQLDKLNKVLKTTRFKVLFDDITVKVSISNNTTFSINFDNTYKDGTINDYLSLGYYLGYRKIVYTIPVPIQVHCDDSDNDEKKDTTVGYIGDSILDTQGDTYIFVKINNYGNFAQDYGKIVLQDGVYTTQQKQVQYFAKILLNGPKMSIIFDTGANFISKTVNLRQPENISKLQIQLYEPNGELIDMLNFDYSLTLEFTYILNSAVKTKMEAGLMQPMSAPTQAPSQNPPEKATFTNVEPFDIMDNLMPPPKDKLAIIKKVMTTEPVFKSNLHLAVNTKKKKESIKNINTSLFDYVMDKPPVEKEKRKKKKKNKFGIDYSS